MFGESAKHTTAAVKIKHTNTNIFKVFSGKDFSSVLRETDP